MNTIENSFFKGMTLDELICFAKSLEFKEPEKPLEQWSDDECSFGSLSIALKNPVQIKSFKGICKMLPPLTLIFKQRLKNYIKMFYINQSQKQVQKEEVYENNI